MSPRPMSPYRLPDALLESLLHDDAPCGDATTFALGIGQRPGRLIFRARQAMVLCGSEEACRMGELRDLVSIGAPRESGSALAAGDEILRLEGAAARLHVVWKTAQTLIEYLSGIASSTAAIKAVLCGGASPHRLSLSETLLVFPEHRVFLEDDAPASIIEGLRRLWPERAIVVEADSEGEARRWIDAGADILQLEKMSVEALRGVVDYAASGATATRIAAAGGVNAGNAEAYARAGARILVTSAPYFAAPRDVAVTLEPCL